MGSDMGASAPAPQMGADGQPVDTHGTARDFGNMLNAHMGKPKKKKHGYSPWLKMGAK